MATISIRTAPGTSASAVGDAHTAEFGSWRDSVDRCDSDGCGRVFIECDTDDVNYIADRLDDDARVVDYTAS